MTKKTYRKFQDPLEVKMCNPEYWRTLNLKAIAEYEKAKKRGKTKRSDALVEKYRQANGTVIAHDFYWRLDVLDIPGKPVKTLEYPAVKINAQPSWFYELGGAWCAEIEPNMVSVWWSGDGEPQEYADVIAFAEQNGVTGATEELLRRQVANILAGFKVQTRLSPEWVAFSPIVDNGIRIRFIRDTEGESYIA